MSLDFMPLIYQAVVAIAIGFIVLIWSADRFVAGSASFAKNLGVAPMIIGLTIVSFGTSAPEILVSINAAFSGAGSIAIGNAVGSNIANIGLVLGITALLARIPVHKHILKDELPVLLLVNALAGWCLYDAVINGIEAWGLLLLLLPLMYYLIRKKQKDLSPQEMAAEQEIPEMPIKASLLWLALGLVLLILSAKILVWGAVTTAEYFQVSPLIIGLTVVAIGTSLPELAATVVSALKGHHDIALGNIIGSNIFNLLAVMSIPGIISPISTDAEVFTRDFGAMALLTLSLTCIVALPLLRKLPEDKRSFGRISGAVLLLIYTGYMILLF